jgi:hypothetical protein
VPSLDARRAATFVAPAVALTLGVGVGAVVRGTPGPAAHASRPRAHLSPAVPSQTPRQRTAAYAAGHGFALLDPPSSTGDVDRWDPCVAIHYVTDVEVGPSSAHADIESAFATLASVTGMTFVDDGVTSQRPSESRKDVVHTSEGWRWAPVLIALVPDKEFRADAGHEAEDTIAFTDPDIYTDDTTGDSEIVSAQVVVDADAITGGGDHDPNALVPTLLHELGHVVGLDHVSAGGEIMQADGGGMLTYGPGDRDGLRYVGLAHGCIGDPALPEDSQDFPGSSNN